MNYNLAIFSHSQNAYSETFIQAHKKLEFNIKFYYDGFLPTKLENAKSLIELSLWERFEKKKQKKFTLQEYALFSSLRREKIDCVLAEYGPTAVHTLEILKELKIPLVVHFHGYDASVRVVLENYEKDYLKVFQYASSIISVSNHMTASLIEMGCPKDKIVMAVYGAHPDFEKNKPLFELPYFVSVGRFVEKKAPYLTILAFSKVVQQFPFAKLKMIGDGDLIGISRDLVKVLELYDNVEFLGIQTPA